MKLGKETGLVGREKRGNVGKDAFSEWHEWGETSLVS